MLWACKVHQKWVKLVAQVLTASEGTLHLRDIVKAELGVGVLHCSIRRTLAEFDQLSVVLEHLAQLGDWSKRDCSAHIIKRKYVNAVTAHAVASGENVLDERLCDSQENLTALLWISLSNARHDPAAGLNIVGVCRLNVRVSSLREGHVRAELAHISHVLCEV